MDQNAAPKIPKKISSELTAYFGVSDQKFLSKISDKEDNFA